MPFYGAIDIGTNATRLLIGSPGPDGLIVSDSMARETKLGESLVFSGLLSEDAQERTLSTLKTFKERLEILKVEKTRFVATQACRSARNRSTFIKRAKEEVGVDVEVITAQEEARLAMMGCQDVLDPQIQFSLIFDIGGGSTEVIWTEKGSTLRDWISIPYGIVSVADRIFEEDSKIDRKTIYHEIRRFLGFFQKKNNIFDALRHHSVQVVGVSGITTVAAFKLRLHRYDRNLVHNVRLTPGDVKQFSRFLWNNSDEWIHRCRPFIGNRLPLVRAGQVILEAICDTFPTFSFQCANRGLREGILHDFFTEEKNLKEETAS